MRARTRFDGGMETTIAQAKKRTNTIKTIFANAKAWLVNLADRFLAGLRPVSALVTA